MIRQLAAVLTALHLLPALCQDDFDKAFSSTNSELSGILQDVQSTAPAATAAHATTDNPPDIKISSMISDQPAPVEAELQLPLPGETKVDSKLPMPQRIKQMSKNLKTGTFVQTKLRSTIAEQGQMLQDAKDLVHRELNVLEQETLLKLKESSQVKKLQEKIASMREQAAAQDKLLEAARKRTMLAQSGAEESEALDGSASTDLQWAKQRAAAAHARLLDAKGKWQNEYQAANAKIARLTNTIDSMRSEMAGEQSQGNRFEANSTVLLKQIQQIQSQIATTSAAKQSADINVAQVIHKWQATLQQLREQVGMNAKLEQQAKGGIYVQKEITDLEQQVKQRDTQITDLQEQVDEMSMGTGQALRGAGSR